METMTNLTDETVIVLTAQLNGTRKLTTKVCSVFEAIGIFGPEYFEKILWGRTPWKIHVKD